MNQFGGGTQDDYGYFAPTRGSSGGGSAQFGAAPTGTATAAPVGGFGGVASYGPPATLQRSGNPVVKRVVALLVVAVVAVGGWFGWTAYQLSRPLVVPGTLSAMSPVTVAKVKQVKEQVEQQWQAQYPGKELAIEVYSGHKQSIILAMARAKSDVEKDFADAGFTGELQPVGKATCATMAGGLVACERTSRTLSAMVLVFNGTAQDAAAALNEAWELQ